jgi:hypothetical protein
LKQILEFPDGFIKQVESSDIRWQPDFGTWPESLTGINYINPYQSIMAGFNDEGAHIHRFSDSVYLYGIENEGYVAFYNLDFDDNTDTFSIVCSAASENWGKAEIRIDSLNGDLAGTCQLPRTSGWYDTKTYSCPVTIPKGIHNIYLLFYSDNWHVAGVFKSIFFVKSGINSKQPPYNGIAIDLPGKIEAEEYDIGGRNTSYSDKTTGNEGERFRFEDVDIETTIDIGLGYNVGWIENGEWLEYTINCPKTYIMDIQLRIACMDPGEKIRIKLDGQILGTVTLPNTSGWQNWETVTLEDVTIPAGDNQILRLEFLDSGFNLNWLNFIGKEILNLNGAENKRFVTFYPNPAQDQIMVNTHKKAFLKVYNIYGQLMIQEELSVYENKINVSGLSPGSYIVKIADGTHIHSEILIIE